MTLANNTRSLYLNGEKIFPALPTIPIPPQIPVAVLHPDFSYENLTSATTCSNPTCTGKISADCTEWCQTLPLDRMLADYSYSAHIQREEADADQVTQLEVVSRDVWITAVRSPECPIIDNG